MEGWCEDLVFTIDHHIQEKTRGSLSSDPLLLVCNHLAIMHVGKTPPILVNGKAPHLHHRVLLFWFTIHSSFQRRAGDLNENSINMSYINNSFL